MFSWITGPRITNVIEELQPDPAYDTTFIEPPDTPAHQFAVNAFKHAIFGTPTAEDTNGGAKKLEKRSKINVANSRSAELSVPVELAPPSSPSKPGILMTPGTAAKGRKTVSFGSQVVDNESKRSNVGGSGIPGDCPGKFPSPWTFDTEPKVDTEKDKMLCARPTAALYDARKTTQLKAGQGPKARDDSDITIDMGSPRSESGKYWKQQYESYAERSEKEIKKLVTKQQVAKNFAKRKDGEMTELATRLAEERKRFRNRERELAGQNREYQERLRQAMAENAAASMEITALKNRVAVLEKSLVSFSEVQESKTSFQIYEDSRDTKHFHLEEDKTTVCRPRSVMEPPAVIFGRSIEPTQPRTANKENSPPKPRHTRHQTLPGALSVTLTSRSAISETGTESLEAGEPLSKSAFSTVPPSKDSPNSTFPPLRPEHSSSFPLSIRQGITNRENIPLNTTAYLLSSPLPQSSPDPWMQNLDNSPLPQIDKIALPISSGAFYKEPTKYMQRSKPTPHRTTKTISQPTKDNCPENIGTLTEKPLVEEPEFHISKTASQQIEDSSLARRDRVELPVDRKEQARRRLMERKQKRLK
ncbi:hypothetical protein CC78DRAFT_617210 [Lojkania enalia]|uniref:Spindle pole body-associated protein cut12 domain-containing protein n=1 Tax=Lojkania enalia TaxID=147567 RepID=A0A9P4K745_9PLEO|nr:hypothetical protein CC78DRAFT_617210 [Didymosphaeria enalia]